MKRKLEAIILDMDGVLADTFYLYYLANKMTAEKLGITFSEKDNEPFRGIGRKETVEALVKMAGKNVSEEEQHRLREEKNEYYQQLIADLDEKAVLPGMKRFVKEASDRGFRLAVASSSTNAPVVLNKTGLDTYLNAVVDPASLTLGKPDPEIFLKAAEMIDVSPEACAVIEDGEAGLLAAKQAGMFTVGIGTSARQAGPDWSVSGTEEVTMQDLVEKFEEKQNG